MGVEPCYFPLFVTQEKLAKEEDHLEGFAAEVAWVTQSGKEKLDKPIAIRPTSETIMYPAFRKWIQSHRDLPIKLNQWTNVVRWEFKNPTPFLRTREFLWQEGHTAYEKVEDADKEVLDILDLYARVYEELLAVPVIKGRKSEGERFPGGRYTTTVEAYIPTARRAIQGATSHSLGQNFAKMFDIKYEDPDSKNQKDKSQKFKMPWQNSWGLTTRSLGVMIMVHGDDMGLVLPPRVAPIQVVIVYIEKSKMSEDEVRAMANKAKEIHDMLRRAGVRAHVDDRSNYSGGFKFSHWELKGVPMILTLGGREMQSKEVECSLRLDRADKTKKKSKAKLSWDKLTVEVPKILESVQTRMLCNARKERDAHISVAMNMTEFKRELNKGNMILAPWCELKSTEDLVKEMTRDCGTNAEQKDQKKKSQEEKAKSLTGSAKPLCLPFNQPPMFPGTKCFTGNGELARSWCLSSVKIKKKRNEKKNKSHITSPCDRLIKFTIMHMNGHYYKTQQHYYGVLNKNTGDVHTSIRTQTPQLQSHRCIQLTCHNFQFFHVRSVRGK